MRSLGPGRAQGLNRTLPQAEGGVVGKEYETGRRMELKSGHLTCPSCGFESYGAEEGGAMSLVRGREVLASPHS